MTLIVFLPPLLLSFIMIRYGLSSSMMIMEGITGRTMMMNTILPLIVSFLSDRS